MANQVNEPLDSIAENTSPLSEFLNLLTGLGLSPVEQQLQADALNIRIQELTASCMNEQGFEYAINQTTALQIPDTDFTLWHPEDREWVAQWGYGQVLAPTADPTVRHQTFDSATDPNTAIRAALTPAEDEAWQFAYYGGPDYDTNPGCWVTAQLTANAETPSGWARESQQFAPLMSAIDEFWESLSSDIPFEHERDWSYCMADAGYPGFDWQRDAQFSVLTELMELRNNGVFEGLFWDPVIAAQSGELAPELTELREKEIDLALADFDCRQSTNYDAREAARITEAETQFLNDHRQELEALRDAIEQRS